MINNYINKLNYKYASMISSLMGKILQPNDRYYRFNWFKDNIFKFIPKRSMQYMSLILIINYLKTYPNNFKYYSKIEDIRIKTILSISPYLIVHIKNPSYTLQHIAVNKNPNCLFNIEKPDDDIILLGLEKVWDKLYYLRILNSFEQSHYFRKEFNKMKLRKGTLYEKADIFISY